MGVKADFAFVPEVEGLTGTFTQNSLVLATAEGTEVENAPKDETAFSVRGGAIDADKSLGTITVTVAKNNAEATYEVTAEQFESLLGNLTNYKMYLDSNSDADSGDITTLYDGTSVRNIMTGNDYIITSDGTDYYKYGLDQKSGEWLKEKVTKADLDNALLLGNILSLLKGSYADLTYDAATRTYKNNGTITVTYLDSSAEITDVSISFKNGALYGASFNYNAAVITYNDFGTTEVKLPTADLHEHTYSETGWGYDSTHHWRNPSCGHDVSNENNDTLAEHTFDENGVCTACGYAKNNG